MDKINTLDYVSQFLPKKYIHTCKLKCFNCSHTFKQSTYCEKADYTKLQSDTDTWISLLKCPHCDKDWRKTAGICWETYPYLKKAMLKE